MKFWKWKVCVESGQAAEAACETKYFQLENMTLSSVDVFFNVSDSCESIDDGALFLCGIPVLNPECMTDVSVATVAGINP